MAPHCFQQRGIPASPHLPSHLAGSPARSFVYSFASLQLKKGHREGSNVLILHLATHTARRIIAAALLHPAAPPQLGPCARGHLGTPQPPRCVERLGHLAATSPHGGRGATAAAEPPQRLICYFFPFPERSDLPGAPGQARLPLSLGNVRTHSAIAAF